MASLIDRRMKIISRVAKLTNEADRIDGNATGAQFIAWGSKEEPPCGVVRLVNGEIVQEPGGRRYVLGLCQVNGRWTPHKFAVCADEPV